MNHWSVSAGSSQKPGFMKIQGHTIEDLTPLIEAYMRAKEDSAPFAGTMIGILAQAVVDAELSDMEALGILTVLIAAGGESTTSLTGTAVRILAERADLQHQLRGDPSLVPAFVEEACRFDPPFCGHYRTVKEDVELEGTTVPAGSHLVLVWPAANRDPAAYDQPDEVRLTDPTHGTTWASGGASTCALARPLRVVEAKVAIETLLAKTRWLRVDPEVPPLQYHVNLMVRRLVSLPLVLELAS